MGCVSITESVLIFYRKIFLNNIYFLNLFLYNGLYWYKINFKNFVEIALFRDIAISSNAQTPVEPAKPASTIKNNKQRIKQGVKVLYLQHPKQQDLQTKLRN